MGGNREWGRAHSGELSFELQAVSREPLTDFSFLLKGLGVVFSLYLQPREITFTTTCQKNLVYKKLLLINKHKEKHWCAEQFCHRKHQLNDAGN